jgi:hypothetical protein
LSAFKMSEVATMTSKVPCTSKPLTVHASQSRCMRAMKPATRGSRGEARSRRR